MPLAPRPSSPPAPPLAVLPGRGGHATPPQPKRSRILSLLMAADLTCGCNTAPPGGAAGAAGAEAAAGAAGTEAADASVAEAASSGAAAADEKV